MGDPVTLTLALVATTKVTLSPARSVPDFDTVSVTPVTVGWTWPRSTAVTPSVVWPRKSVSVSVSSATPTVPAGAAAVRSARKALACAAVPVKPSAPPAPAWAPSRLSDRESSPAVSVTVSVRVLAGFSENSWVIA